MKIFIASVPHKMDEAELKQLLTQYGQVSSVKLVVDKETGKRKGFGFIEMPVSEQAHKAIAGLDGKEFYGRKIALTESVEKQPEGRSAPEARQQDRDFSRRPRSSRSSEEIDGNKW